MAVAVAVPYSNHFALFQIDNHADTSPLSFFTDRMPLLPPNQERQSTEGKHQTHSGSSVRSGTVFKIISLIHLSVNLQQNDY